MILIFHMPPLAKGQELSDIDRVWFRVTQKNNEESWYGGVKPIFRHMEKL